MTPRSLSPARHAVVIEPRSGWRRLGVVELWEHRELLYFLVWRDLKVRYKQTLFGAAWAILQPVLLMVVFSLTLGRIPGVGPEGFPYPLFVFAALVPWTLFAQGMAGASASLVTGEAIITKVYFPRLLVPVAAAASFVPDLLIGLGVMVVLMFGYGMELLPTAIWLAPLTALALAVTVAVGTFLGALNVRYRDVKHVVPFLLQLWLFATPVVYSSSLVPEQWRWLYALNPMTGVVEGFRWALLGGQLPGVAIAASMVVTAFALLGALLYFGRTERTFADVI